MSRAGIAIAVVLALTALVVQDTEALSQEDAQEKRLIDTVCAIPPVLLERTLHGHRDDRAGEIQLLTHEPDFVGHGGLPHSGPWDYVGQVPLFWYGPGYVPATGPIDRRVTLADVAPTQAELLGFDFDTPDGEPLLDALVPREDRPEPPALLVVLVWDGAGNNVLAEHPDAWPNLRALTDEGVWYTRAEVGSSPPSTAQIHATIGTGAFSATHGVIAHHFRIGDRIATPWEAGPRYLMRPTLADLYDRALGNRPLIGVSATVAIQLGMVGHGSLWGGGDRDLVVLREREGAATLGAEGISWNLPTTVAPFYQLPGYANDLPPLSTYVDDVDRADGRFDGKWRDVEIESEAVHFGLQTPARIPFQDRLIEELISREGFGDDEVTDLFFINHKLIDEVGHVWSMNSVEMEDSIRAEDAALPGLIELLNREVGEGRWVMALTADHGHTPDPEVSGADVISPTDVGRQIAEEFDRDGDDVSVLEYTQPTEVFLDERELADEGHTLADVAEYLLGRTKGDVGGDIWPIPEENRAEPAFLAAYPSDLLDRLPCLPPGEG
jgi:hypothetical protein